MAETSFRDGFEVPFRDYVLKDVELATLVEGRFYPQHLATFYTNSTTFPLATFYEETGSMPNFTIIQKFNVVIQAYSNVSYDEAYEIHKAIYERLGGTNGPISIPTRIVIRPLTTPAKSFDEKSRLFSVYNRFTVTWIP